MSPFTQAPQARYFGLQAGGFYTSCIHIILKSDKRVNIQNRPTFYILLPLFHFDTISSMFCHNFAPTRSIRLGYFPLSSRHIMYVTHFLNIQICIGYKLILIHRPNVFPFWALLQFFRHHPGIRQCHKKAVDIHRPYVYNEGRF